jgi:hypothetical protein
MPAGLRTIVRRQDARLFRAVSMASLSMASLRVGT